MISLGNLGVGGKICYSDNRATCLIKNEDIKTAYSHWLKRYYEIAFILVEEIKYDQKQEHSILNKEENVLAIKAKSIYHSPRTKDSNNHAIMTPSKAFLLSSPFWHVYYSKENQTVSGGKTEDSWT